jgi:Peptidase C13 family
MGRVQEHQRGGDMSSSSIRRVESVASTGRWIRWLAIAMSLAAATGCAQLSPNQASAAARSAALERQQDERAAQQAADAPGRRVWLAGFAMSSTSTAFQGDLELASRRLSDLGGPVMRYEHSDEVHAFELRYPFADLATLRESMQRIGARARDDDIVVVFISTHGSKKVLSVNVAQTEYEGLTASQLADALSPLGDRPTVVILAACFSGSFVPELRRDTRVVLTAASAERTSYGCDASGRNTFFVEELFKNNFDPGESMLQMMGRVRLQTLQRENRMHITHSDPQIYVGANVLWLLDRPLNRWFEPGTALAGPIADLDAAGKVGYARYLSEPYPSAFVIGAGGHWSSAWTPLNAGSPDDPVARALESCNRRTTGDCRVYSVDGRVLPPGDARSHE